MKTFDAIASLQESRAVGARVRMEGQRAVVVLGTGADKVAVGVKTEGVVDVDISGEGAQAFLSKGPELEEALNDRGLRLGRLTKRREENAVPRGSSRDVLSQTRGVERAPAEVGDTHEVRHRIGSSESDVGKRDSVVLNRERHAAAPSITPAERFSERDLNGNSDASLGRASEEDPSKGHAVSGSEVTKQLSKDVSREVTKDASERGRTGGNASAEEDVASAQSERQGAHQGAVGTAVRTATLMARLVQSFPLSVMRTATPHKTTVMKTPEPHLVVPEKCQEVLLGATDVSSTQIRYM